jgi:putative SOS response-associated peptidase YedK
VLGLLSVAVSIIAVTTIPRVAAATRYYSVPTMCGRYTLIRLADFTDIFPWIHLPEQLPPDRYNIAPTQPVAVVPNDGLNRIEFFHWGLIPPWAKDPAVGSRMINARAESLAQKPAYRNAFRRRRCLIPASGFYEWKKLPSGGKQPMYIRLKSKRPFAFAGLWETWRDDNGNEVPSCTILTGQPNELVRPIHDRMPVMLREDQSQAWLDAGEIPSERLLPLILEPYAAEQMEAFPVSKRVNSAANESPDCVLPETPAAIQFEGLFS